MKINETSGSGGNWGGIHFRKTDIDDKITSENSSGYLLMLRINGIVQLFRLNPLVPISAEYELAERNVDWHFIHSKWHHFRMELLGSNIRIFIDGKLALDVNDNSFDGLNSYTGFCVFKTVSQFDNLRIYPVDALCKSQSYDPNTLNISNVIDKNGNITIYNYDNFNRLHSIVNDNLETKNIYNYYYSRDGNGGIFNTSDPNYVSTKTHFQDYFEDDFSDADQTYLNWQKVWGNWYVSGGELVQSQNGEACYYLMKTPSDNYSDFNLSYRQKSTDDDRIGIVFRYTDENNHYRFLMHKQSSPYWRLYKVENGSLIMLATNSNVYNQSQWYKVGVICKGENIKIYVDDELVFDVQDDRWVSGKVGFFSEWNSYSYFDDFKIEGYQLTEYFTYKDGIGKEIQTQSNFRESSIKTGFIYDQLNRISQVTKPFESPNQIYTLDPVGAAINYYSTVYPYYPEQVSDVGEYAYNKSEYYYDPLNRIYRTGSPGVSFYIGSGNEIEYRYSANMAGEISSYEENTLFKTKITDENNHESYDYKDIFGNTVYEKQMIGDPPSDALKTQFSYDILENLVSVKSPNYFNPPTGTGTNYITTYAYNTLGELIKKKSPDVESVDYLYDQNGNLRFKKSNSNYFIYYKYDIFYRLIEEGTYTNMSGFTQINADNSDFPVTGHITQILYSYDTAIITGEETHGNLSGKIAQVEYDIPGRMNNGYVLYSYNTLGEIEWIENHIPIDDGTSYNESKIEYEYDRYGKIIKIHYCKLNPTSNDFYVWYDYDELGRIHEVMSNTTEIRPTVSDAKYTYWPTGQVKRLILGDVQGMDYLYNSRDWLTQINHQNLNSDQDPGHDGSGNTIVDRFGEIIGYNKQNLIANDNDYLDDYESMLNGNISWLVTSTYGNNDPFWLTGWLYNYDETNRLKRANWGYYSEDLQEWAATNKYDISGITYDHNGNLDYMQRYDKDARPTDMDYNYIGGTNKINYIDGYNDQISSNYMYDNEGNMIKDVAKLGTSNTITYDYRNLPTTVPTASGTIKYGYDHSGQRVNKNNYIYIRGIDGRIIAGYDTEGNHLFWNVWGLDLICQKF